MFCLLLVTGNTTQPNNSVWEALAHLVYLTITYQLVKLFGAPLKRAAKSQVESLYIKCGILES